VNPAPSSEIGVLCAVIVCVMLAGFFRVVSRVNQMTVRDMCVMPGLMVVAGFVMFGCNSVMFGGVLVMFSSFAVVICGFF
jgi:hypothetical protein